MKKLSLTLMLLVTSILAQAQFGPGGGFGGGGGGQRGGDGGGRRSQENRGNGPSNELNLDGKVPRGNSKVLGFVIDDNQSAAVEFANVALYTKDKKTVDGTMADDKGKFSIGRIAPGDYVLKISFIGYQEKSVEFKVEKGKDTDLGIIKMAQSVKQLDGVTVTAEKAMIEEKVDRLVYNAEKDLSARGGDAADVLRKVPMLSVDLDGNPSLRGSSNLRVLINNKPSTIVASSIADALKMIPADLIKTVEVITSPSAKYDAEGSAGIINIILKKSTLQGLTLNIDAGVGIRGSNLGLNGNYRQGKLGVTLGGFGRLFYNAADIDLKQNTNRNGASILTDQFAAAYDNGLFGRYNLGFDYDLAKNQSLSASVAFGTRNFRRDQDFTIKQFTDNVLRTTTYRDVDTKDLSNSIDINLDYIHTFKPSQEWSVSGQFSQNNLTNDFDAFLLNSSRTLQSRQRNLNKNFNKEITLQTDYQTPIGKNQMFEVGVKTVLRRVDSDFEYLLAGATGDFVTDARNPTGFLNYNQNIAAGYVSYTFSTKNKYTFKLGTRYERTTITANDQRSDILIPAYDNFVPSINISKSLGKGTTIKLAYNNRIQRPGLQQLNPNFNASNPQSISIGNPNLKPEVSNNLELSVSANINKTYLNISLFGRQTNNSITRISMPSDSIVGAIITTFENIGKEQTLGTNVFGNVSLTQKWTLNGGFDLFYNYLEGQQTNANGLSSTINNSGVVISGRMQSSISLAKGWGIQIFGGFRGNRVQLQGMQGGMGMYSVGFRKDFANKKGSLGLAAENFFGIRVTNTLETPQFNQVSVNNIYNQNLKLTFSYKIGKMRFTESKKSKLKNDDVKSSGDN
jgi:ferric enterobactin receptor